MNTQDLDLREGEEKAMVGILYNHITYATTMEVFGELTPEGVDRIDVLRGIFLKLLKKYELTDTLSPDAYLLLGITGSIPHDALQSWVSGSNGHLRKRAEYFLKKITK